jgi:hypothetical protein
MSVLLLQMAHAEDVEDLVGLDGTLPEAVEGGPVPPPDAGEGTSAIPTPGAAGEDLAPAPAPTGEADPKVVAGRPPSRQPKTPQLWPGLRRWLTRC